MMKLTYKILEQSDIPELTPIMKAAFDADTSMHTELEEEYTEARTWMLETPDYSKRNHHFYEKCGFKKIGEHVFEDGGKSFVFIKHTKNGIE